MKLTIKDLLLGLTPLLIGAFCWTAPAEAGKPLVVTQHSPAKWAGRSNCTSKFGAFKDATGVAWNKAFRNIIRNQCWSCPASAPRRTTFPVKSNKACKRSAYKKYKRAIGPEKPTGKLVKTKCQKGWFLDVGKGRCYSCQGYKRSLRSVTGAKACYKKIKAKRVAARYRGKAGCGKGKFRNGVLDQCYSCPRGYARGIALGKDLTKQPKACFRVTVNPPKLRVKPPKGLIKRAMKEIRPYTDLIVQAVLSLPRAQKALLTGQDPKKYQDKELAAAIARFNKKHRRAGNAAPVQFASASGDIGMPASQQQARLRIPPIRHFSIGVVGDGTSPYLIGGNGSAEVVWRTGRAKPVGLMLGASVTAGVAGIGGVPGLGGDGSVFAGFYTVNEADLKGFSWSVEIGYRTVPVTSTASPAGVLPLPIPPAKQPKGLDIQAVFLFDNRPGIQAPKFAGLIIGTGIGTPGGEADIGINYSALIKKK